MDFANAGNEPRGGMFMILGFMSLALNPLMMAVFRLCDAQFSPILEILKHCSDKLPG